MWGSPGPGAPSTSLPFFAWVLIGRTQVHRFAASVRVCACTHIHTLHVLNSSLSQSPGFQNQEVANYVQSGSPPPLKVSALWRQTFKSDASSPERFWQLLLFLFHLLIGQQDLLLPWWLPWTSNVLSQLSPLSSSSFCPERDMIPEAVPGVIHEPSNSFKDTQLFPF